jgi:hypothetical protein
MIFAILLPIAFIIVFIALNSMIERSTPLI